MSSTIPQGTETITLSNGETADVPEWLADLMQGPLKGSKLKMHKVDPKTGDKTVIEIGG